MKSQLLGCAALVSAAFLPFGASASSHREAPSIAGMPRLDGTDFYMFRSYEPGRSGYVTFIANYIPLQEPAGGPNFYAMETNGEYQIHVVNDGSTEDYLTFTFRFSNSVKDLTVPSGNLKIPVPLINIGAVTTAGTNVNALQSYTVDVHRAGWGHALAENASYGGSTFLKPVDNVGQKSIPDYPTYAQYFIQDISIPGCTGSGKVFVGQRKEGFVVNLGEVFDLVNLNPAGPRNAEPNTLFDKNITSIALEVPISCLVSKSDPVIGGYTTSRIVETINGGVYSRQVSRLGMPLVNELVIGLPDKDRWNSSKAKDDGQFLNYVTNPSLPVLLNVLFGSAALVPETPRDDLVAAFLTGVKGINQPVKVTPSEMLRLNTSTPPTAPAAQNDLGVLGGDLAGFPNGRRPYDDVVDITLRVAEGALCGTIGACGNEKTDPNHGTPYTDEARAAGPDAQHLTVAGAVKATDTYLTRFPYLNNPIPGSPNSANGASGLTP